MTNASTEPSEGHFHPRLDLQRFDSDGYAPIPDHLDRQLIEELLCRVDSCMSGPLSAEHVDRVADAQVLRSCWELDVRFRDLLAHPLVTHAARSILGDDYRATGMSCIRTPPGGSILPWHVDDVVEFPLPEGHPGHPREVPAPCFLLGIQIPLTDIESPQHGPTQYVPGSHRSGRQPGENLQFRGRTPVDILSRAGHGYVQNFQCWHRGSLNTSERTRYLFQIILSPGWMVRRCGHARQHLLSSRLMAGASDVVCRTLGWHTA